MLANQGRSGPNARSPPSWGPEQAHRHRYSFKDWSRDILVWTILSELEPCQADAVILQLRGGADEFARGLPPVAIIAVGMVNGVMIDPMAYLMHSLSEKCTQLGEEARLSALTGLMTFAWRPGERIDDLITCFDSVRQRANDAGQLALSVQCRASRGSCSGRLGSTARSSCACSSPQHRE